MRTCRLEQRVPPAHFLVREPGVVAAETVFFFNDFRERLYAVLQQREERALIRASLCANLHGAVLATQSCNREHFVSLAVFEAAVRTFPHGHIDRRPVTNHPFHPNIFGDERSMGRADLALLAWQRGALAPCNFHAVVSARSDALVCESPKPWRVAFAPLRLTQNGLHHH